MYEDAFKLMQDLAKMKAIESIKFLHSGKVSVKFYPDPNSIQFNEVQSIIETAENYEKRM